MPVRLFIDGAEGTTGLEIRRRVEDRPDLQPIVLPEDERRDPAARRAAMAEADIAVLCLPDDAAREAAGWAEATSTRVIDASSAHRTAPGWVYGFPELVGEDAVANARRVSNPGCYPTGFLALVAPLIRAGLLPADCPYMVHAVSGYSGGGKALIERFEAEPEIAYRAYGFGLDHKHLPEMRIHAGLTHDPVFCPAVVPAYRGMLVEVPLPLGAMPGAAQPDVLREALQVFYDGSGRIALCDEAQSELLLRTDAPPHDGIDLFVFASPDGAQARLVARLDNLGKGASGAALQSLDLMTRDA